MSRRTRTLVLLYLDVETANSSKPPISQIWIVTASIFRKISRWTRTHVLLYLDVLNVETANSSKPPKSQIRIATVHHIALVKLSYKEKRLIGALLQSAVFSLSKNRRDLLSRTSGVYWRFHYSRRFRRYWRYWRFLVMPPENAASDIMILPHRFIPTENE